METRREFLKKAALLTGAAGLSSPLFGSIQRALAIAPEPGSSFLDAEHVVILMQENRSFDHAFGTLRGVRGYNDPRAITLPNGNPVWVQTNAAGRYLDGAVGTALFSGTGAADLRVALTDPRGIAAAQGTNLADNANAIALAEVAQQTFPALGGATLGDYFGMLHARVGQDARRAEQNATIEENVSAALAAQREAISGVSLDVAK